MHTFDNLTKYIYNKEVQVKQMMGCSYFVPVYIWLLRGCRSNLVFIIAIAFER